MRAFRIYSIIAFRLTHRSLCIYTSCRYPELISNSKADGFIGSHNPPRHSCFACGIPGWPRDCGVHGDRGLELFGFNLHDGDHLVHDRIWRSQPGQPTRTDFHIGSDRNGGRFFSLRARQRGTIPGGRPYPANIREAQIGQANRPAK